MLPGSNDMIAFDEYLDILESISNSKAGIILQNVQKGIDLYMQSENEAKAIRRMNFNFDNQLDPRF